LEGAPLEAHDHGHGHGHMHTHVQHDEHGYAQVPWAPRAPAPMGTRIVQMERDILEKNNRYAAANRTELTARGVQALNLMSSPGSGKTTLLVKTIESLCDARPIAVIEGDQETARDAERIRATGAPALQINTGKGCHLDAQAVGHAIAELPLRPGSLLLIENVGNLVCPAAFDLGEAHKVVVWSVTEGEDKPLKYPDMFRAASLLLLNKCDLLPYLEFDVGFAIECAHRVNPGLPVIQISAKTGAGMPEWLAWIESERHASVLAHGI
jgi:hydrogenase nickel incorporation protein HypB